jgi:hypothetical protein
LSLEAKPTVHIAALLSLERHTKVVVVLDFDKIFIALYGLGKRFEVDAVSVCDQITP